MRGTVCGRFGAEDQRPWGGTTRHEILCVVEHRRRIWAIAVGVFVLLAACGGDEASAPQPSGADAGDEVLLRGRDVWISRCAQCHGSDGGGGMGPRLDDGAAADRYPRVEDQLDVVRSGRGAMPAWEGRLSAEEIEAVVRYTREVL
jgi:mono/diheme cytochrome c family protein